jgi:CheY-like chemotaxis protein
VPDPVRRPPDVAPGLAGPGTVPSGSRTVLLVEDNVDNRTIYGTLLRHVGYRVLDAADGETALTLARAERPDLVLMDVTLPVLDGLEATRRLKADAATRAIPVIALTAHASEESRAACLGAGCDGYLAKPIAPRDVLAEVQRMLAG